MGKYINCGKYNKNYIYIFIECIIMLLKYYLPSILMDIFKSNGKIDDYTSLLFEHEHILDIFRFFGMLIFSFFFYIYEKKSSKGESYIEKSNDSNLEKGCFEDIKNNDKRIENKNDKKKSFKFKYIDNNFYLCNFRYFIIYNLFLNYFYFLVGYFINNILYKCKNI